MNRKKKCIVFLLVVCFTIGWSFQTLAAGGQWVLKDGNWMYKTDNGTYKSNTWFQDTDKVWYHFDENGCMQTGWLSDSGVWYYLNSSGAMRTGWLSYNGAWYYLSGSGAMQTDWVQVGNSRYYLNSSGVMQTGWLKDNSRWYYFENSGAMLVNVTKTIQGVSYTFGPDGAWIEGAGTSVTSAAFSMGSWTNKTFTNKWSNIKITMPSDSEVFTTQQMKNTVGTGQKILVNDGTITESAANAYSDMVIYDFIVRLGDQTSVLQLAYLNISSGAASVTVENYAAALGEELAANNTLPHTIEGTERATLGGNDYIKLRTTMLSRTTCQDIYMRKLDHYMVILTVTYLADNVSYVNSALTGFASAQ